MSDARDVLTINIESWGDCNTYRVIFSNTNARTQRTSRNACCPASAAKRSVTIKYRTTSTSSSVADIVSEGTLFVGGS